MQPLPESAHRLASSTASSTASAAAPRRSVGCMAGLLRLLSPYHRSHHRKRLTAKNATPAASPPPPSSPQPKKKPTEAPSPSQEQPQPHPQLPTAVQRRRSCDALRMSPTIVPEHRRASCDSPRPPPPAIVARLMGLEESAPPSPAAAPRPLPTRSPPPPPPESAVEKRRKLLGALEKCDEDLKTLRRIIAAVRAAEMREAIASDVSSPTGAGKGSKWMDGRDEQSPSPSPSPPQTPQQQKPRAEEQYPSPDSVLDAITSPRFPCRKRPSPCTNLDADSKPSCGNAAVGSKIVKPSRALVFSGDYCKIKPGNELHAVAMYHHPVVAIESIPRWILPLEAESGSWRHRRRWDLKAPAGRSRAMVESVGEVWGQGAGEERCEAGRVGAALERAILHDLVRDVVADLLSQSGRATQAPHGGGAMCRKSLCF